MQKTEKLGKGDEWYCSTCKEHVEATKTIEIYRSPPVLVLQLNRFKAHNSYFREKVEDFVSCPIGNESGIGEDGLDISPYIVKPKEGESYVYDLCGVTQHSGGLGGGHYTAHCKNSET